MCGEKKTKEEVEYFMTAIGFDFNDKELQRIADMINTIPCKSFDLEYMSIWEDDNDVND